MQINFQAGVEDIYDACVAKGSTPVSTSLSDIIDGIMNIPSGITPSGTISITSNGTGIDVSQYASANVAVPNSNSATYTYPANSTGGKVDLGATNSYRYVNAANVYAKGKTDGASTYTWKIVFSLPKPGSLTAYRNNSNVFNGGISDGESVVISGSTIKWG